jgi:hypothetical protein
MAPPLLVWPDSVEPAEGDARHEAVRVVPILEGASPDQAVVDRERMSVVMKAYRPGGVDALFLDRVLDVVQHLAGECEQVLGVHRVRINTSFGHDEPLSFVVAPAECRNDVVGDGPNHPADACVVDRLNHPETMPGMRGRGEK